MIIAEVEFLRGLEWQNMNDLGFFHCDFTEDGCKCEDMQADHVEMHQNGTCPTCTTLVPTECEVLGCQCFNKHINHAEMHRVAMEEIEEGIKNDRLITKQDGCQTCTPTWYVSHRWIR